MTWSRQQRHKARAERPTIWPFDQNAESIATALATGADPGAIMRRAACTCWVRHGQPLPHSATCPAYVHATGPIGDPSDLMR